MDLSGLLYIWFPVDTSPNLSGPNSTDPKGVARIYWVRRQYLPARESRDENFAN